MPLSLSLSLNCVVSVEDILSYRIKCRLVRGTSTDSRSLRILQELSTSCTEAHDVYTKVSEPFDPRSEDYYARVRLSFPVDKRILWIRIAILEGKLAAILETLAAHSRWSALGSSTSYKVAFVIITQTPMIQCQ